MFDIAWSEEDPLESKHCKKSEVKFCAIEDYLDCSITNLHLTIFSSRDWLSEV